jgi:hypothetical protein
VGTAAIQIAKAMKASQVIAVLRGYSLRGHGF